jgi:hypothetical protein
MFKKYCCVWLSMLLMAGALWGQSERGTITGVVKDTSGAAVPGARVSVTQEATNTHESLVTNENGEFTVPSLPAGKYIVRAEKEGFRPAVVNNLPLDASQTVRADLSLEVGKMSDVIEVQANAVQLQTEDAQSSVTVLNKLVNDLPLVVSGAVRSPFDLAQLTPEAKNFGATGFVLGGGQANSYGTSLDGVTVNTTRALDTSWVSTNAPSIDAIDEFTVNTNGFKAEYGHAAGGVMTFVSKSGTNAYHGDAYEFLRNQALDANSFFNNRAGVKRAILKQNDFGGTFGGPVFIPWLYHGKNKTFFFTSYEGFRNRAGATSSTTSVPTAEMYNGDFSKWVDASGKVIPIYDPTSQTTDASGVVHRTQFPGNIIPSSLFDPVSVAAIKTFQSSGVLKPNIAGAPGTLGYVQNNYLISNGSFINPVNKFSVKGDHILSDKDRFTGYYGYNRQTTGPGPDGAPSLPGLYDTTNNYNFVQNSDVFRGSWDHTFTPTVINHFYGGGNNWKQAHNPYQALIGNWKDKVCLGNVPDCNQNLLNLAFSGYNSWGAPANNGSENLIIAFNDDLTFIKGKHTFKAGAMYQIGNYNGFGRQCVSGCANFSYQETGVPGSTNNLNGGNGFASFLLGYADSGSVDTVRYIAQRWPYVSGYFQDDWRITPKLVLNIGLRYDVQLPPTEEQNRFSDFSPTTPNPAAGGLAGALIYAGSGSGRQGSPTLADGWYGGFGPRLGAAYSLDSKTVIRGSFARTFAAITTVTGSTHQRGFTQTFGVSNSNNGVTPTFTLKGGFPAYPVPPFVDPSFANRDNIPWWQGKEATRAPENLAMNLSVQRQLTGSLVLELAYNGLLGSHLQDNILNYDQLNPSYLQQYGPALLTQRFDSPAAKSAGIVAPYPNFGKDWGSGATVARALRPYPQYQSIDTFNGGGDHSGHSTYHAAVIRLEKRYAQGLILQSSYVFSKLLTDADSYWGNGTGGSADQYNRKLEKSIGQYDVTHDLKVGASYELPLGQGKAFVNHGAAAYIIGGWRIAGIATYSSGSPIGINTSYSLSNVLFNGRTPAYVTSYDGWRAPYSGKFDPTVDKFFVPYGSGPFPLQGNNTTLNGIGNVTRYNPKLRYPGAYNENLSVARTFQIHEQVRFEFRAEAFNVFNRVRFGTGSTTLQDPNFGHLTSNDELSTHRQLQLAAKLYF